jgi:hypothetical protein
MIFEAIEGLTAHVCWQMDAAVEEVVPVSFSYQGTVGYAGRTGSDTGTAPRARNVGR